MHRGGFAHVFKDAIRIPKQYLHPLNLDNSSILTCLYYPNPAFEKVRYQGQAQQASEDGFGHDLIFSPIPFELWPFLCRITIRMKDEKGSLAKIASVLAKEGINILISEFHQAGHRYLQWSIVGEFYEIREKYIRKNYYSKVNCEKRRNKNGKDSFQNINKLYPGKNEKYHRLEHIINDQIKAKIQGAKETKSTSLAGILIKQCGDVLHNFETYQNMPNSNKQKKLRFDGKPAIRIKRAKTLPYHFWEVKKDRQFKDTERKNLEAELITLRSRIENSSKPERQVLDNEISKITKKLDGLGFERIAIQCKLVDEQVIFKDGLPFNKKVMTKLFGNSKSTIGFVNVHTTASRIRVSMIPKHHLSKFKKIHVGYSFDGKNKKCEGLISDFSNELYNQGFSIKNLNNKVQSYERYYERGVVEFTVFNSAKEVVDNEVLKGYLEKFKRTPYAHEQLSINVNPLNHYRIFVSIEGIDEDRKKYVSLVQELVTEFGLSSENVVVVEENIHQVTEKVIAELNKCHGMFQFYINFSKKNNLNWLDSEYFSARTLGIPTIRVTEMTQKDNSIHDKDTDPIKVNLKDEAETKKKLRKGIKDLIDKMRENAPSLNRGKI